MRENRTSGSVRGSRQAFHKVIILKGMSRLSTRLRNMEFQNVFTDLRKKAGLSQNDAADRLFVTRQAVSRWERGETVPESETLLAISKLFGVSINTLLGSPRTLV